MLWISRQKFFNKYLPLAISVILVTVAIAAYLTLRPQTPKAEAGWFATGGTWNYRKQLNIDRTKVNTATGTTTPLTNFPVLVNITDNDLKNNASSTGADILFTSSDGTTKLDHEIESYATSTGSLMAWVEVPSLSSTADTVIYMYFGNASATDQSNAAGVWPTSSYKAIYHLKDSTATTVSDSTSNANTGTKVLSGFPAEVNAVIGKGQSFDGANAKITPSPWGVEDSGAFSFSTWVNITSATRMQVMAEGVVGAAGYYMNFNENTGGDVEVGIIPDAGFAAGDYLSVARGLNDGNWHYIAWTQYSKSSRELFIDGISVATGSVTIGTLTTTGEDSKIGGDGSGASPFFIGSADELHVNTVSRSADWIKTEYLNQSSPSTFVTLSGLQVQNRPSSKGGVSTASRGAGGSFGLGNGTWTTRKVITIDHTKVSTASSTTLTNFPMLVCFNSASPCDRTDTDFKTVANAGKMGRTDGKDMLFTTESGVALPYEVEKYSSSTGETIAWVNVPSLSPTTDTTIYLYLGNSSASDQSNANAVWDTNYKGVYHLRENPSTTCSGANEACDSTSFGFNLDSSGSMVSGDQVAGQIDGSMNFDKTDNILFYGESVPTVLTNMAGLTVSAWIKPTDSGENGTGRILSKSAGSGGVDPTGGWTFRMSNAATNSLDFFVNYSTSPVKRVTATSTVTTGAWQYVTATWDGTATGTNMHIYVNGIEASYGTTANASGSRTNDFGQLFDIGNSPNQTSTFNGPIDEARVSDTVRSPDWVVTEYNNQSNPTAFYSIPTARATSTPMLKSRGGVKFR